MKLLIIEHKEDYLNPTYAIYVDDMGMACSEASKNCVITIPVTH